MQPPAPLVVFSDDWGRHPSSSQHLVSRLLGTRPVLWVNTVGTRAPRLDLGSARRALEKLRHWSGRTARAPDDAGTGRADEDARRAPRVVSPRMWPSFASRTARLVNRRLLGAALAPELARLPADPVIVTTLPIVADLVGSLRARSWVYYCVDDFGTWPGYDGRTLGAMERALLARVDTVICASEVLARRVQGLGARPVVLTHGVDLAAWRTGCEGAPAPELEGLEPPHVVFWGVIDRRMDVGWIAALSASLRTGSIVLIGPTEDPDRALRALPRVALRPAVAFGRLPAIAARASVLAMPYADTTATRAMQPLKLKEYLATGRPVVARALPSTTPWRDACDVCDTADAFVRAVHARLDGRVPDAQRRARTRLEGESWDDKALRFGRWLDEAPGPPVPPNPPGAPGASPR